MEYKDLIIAMSDANGAPGFEGEVLEAAKKHLAKNIEIRVDNMLNAEFTPEGFDGTKPYIVFDAHADEVGMMVQKIKDNGLISVIMLGGWDLMNPISQTYRVIREDGSWIKAVVASVPPHFAGNKADLKEEDILLDIGASSRDEVLASGIDLGCPIVPDTNCDISEEGIMMGKAFDCRLGCALVVATMNEAVKKGYTQVKGLLSTQEEMGLRGAGVLAERLSHADCVICFEGTPADDTILPRSEAQAILGEGPQLRLVDKTAIAHPKFVKKIRQLADEAGLKYQVAVRRGGGTNMGKYQHSTRAIDSSVLGVPVRYIHANTGIAKYEDFLSAMEFAKVILIDYFK